RMMTGFWKRLTSIGAGVTVTAFLSACGSGAAPTPAAPSSHPASAAAKPSLAPSRSAAASNSSARVAIKVGYSQVAVAFTPFFVAQDSGLFAKNGLDVTLEQVNGPAAVAALLANEVQLDGLGANELSRAALGGADLVAIATLGDLPVFNLYADTKKYKVVQDLAGQTIGVTSLGSSTDVAARLFLERYGMLGKVNIVPAGGTKDTVLAALTQGLIAGAIMSPEQGTVVGKAGFAPLVEGLKVGIPLNFSVIGVTRGYLKNRPEVVRNFLKTHQQAWTYIANPASKTAVIKVLEQALKTGPDAAEAGYDAWFPVWSGKKVPTIDPEGITNTLKFSDDPKAKAAKGDQFIDNSLIQSIQ
ncbi:MAG TPA: ABC transporter substrate-binding protein, partial [Chloroflexota bacterium]